MSYEDDIDEDEGRPGRFSLERILAAVRRRMLLIGAIALAFAAAAAIVVSMIPNRYEAVAFVQIDPRKKSISNIDGVVSDLTASHTTVESEVEILQSRAIALKVIDKLGLRNDPEFTGQAGGGLFSGFSRKNGAVASSPAPATERLADTDPIAGLLEAPEPGVIEPERDAVAAAFASRLSVYRVRVTLLMEIRFKSSDPVKAARIANTIAEVYLSDQIEEKKRAAGFATELLERKLTELKGKVAEAERKVEQYKAENNIFDASGEVLSEKQLSEQMHQAMLQRANTASAKAKYEQVQKLLASGAGSGSIAEVLKSDSIKWRKDALAAATRREAELETRYGPKHPEIQKVRAEVADAAAQLDAEVQRVVANLRNEYEVALLSEQQLNEGLQGLKQQQVLSKEASVTLKGLQREAETEKQLYEALLGRYRTTSETQNLQLPDARIIERADVPLQHAAPKRKLIVILALIAGLLVGVAITLALEFVTRGITHSDDIAPALEIAHLSSVPSTAVAGYSPDAALRALRMVIAEPRGGYSEAISQARREIDSRTPAGQPRVILVASSLPNENADIIASNLAHHYAMLGRRVLLVDGDLRRAHLTRRLVPKAAKGLYDVLVRGIEFETAVLRDATTGLHLLPAMREAPLEAINPGLLASARMAAVFTFMKRQYDTIIVSAPPLLPVVDGRLLADHADRIVFVMSWTSTPKQLARRALKALGASRQRIAGVIMSGSDPESAETPATRRAA